MGAAALLADLGPLLQGPLGRARRGFDAVDSTNRVAAEWAAEGAPHGALVVTDHQTAGQGRHGRAWTDTPGHNVLVSVVLRPSLRSDRLGLIALAGGLAIAEAAEAFTAPVAPSLKWPNDVLLEGRKTAGVLAQSVPAARPVVVLGMGTNVNQTDFPPEVAHRATSLRLVAGQTVPRAAFLARLLVRLEAHLAALEQGDHTAFRGGVEARLSGLGAPVRVHGPDGEALEGTARGLAPDGGLRVETLQGVHTVHAGDVTLTPA